MNFFDLLKTYEIDFTDYLDEEDIKFDYYQNKKITLPELSNVKDWNSVIQEEWLDDYIVPRDSRIDKVANNLYRNPNYWWVILLVNEINNPFDWILSDQDILELADELYNNDVLDSNGDGQGYYNLRTYQDLLYDYYNKKRQIKIIKPDYITNYIKALKDKAK